MMRCMAEFIAFARKTICRAKLSGSCLMSVDMQQYVGSRTIRTSNAPRWGLETSNRIRSFH